MTSFSSRVARSILPIGFAGLALLVQTGAAKAEINDGLFGALARLFAPPPQPQYTSPAFDYRVQGVRPRRPVRQTSLPRSGHDKPKKIVVRDPKGDAVAEVMNDKTLRRGDIVVLHSGPKVFRGGTTAPYRLSDFEDPRRSSLLGEKTRRDLMALRLQPGLHQAASDTASPTTEAASAQAENGDMPLTITVSLPRKVSQ